MIREDCMQNPWLKQQGITLQQITDEHREEFAGVVAERYYKVVSEAIRKYDPNHLYLGSRLHGKPKLSARLWKRQAGIVMSLLLTTMVHGHRVRRP